MFRPSLPENHGMLFDFGEERYHQMWMKNTLIPLDMIYLDSHFQVVGWVEHAQPHSLQSHRIGHKSRYIVETNRGWISQYRIRHGQRLSVKLLKYKEWEQ